MDLRVRQLVEAFGRGDLAKARDLAEQALAKAADNRVRRQATGVLIESYLWEGEFAGARRAAQLAGDAEALTSISQTEAAYRAEVARWQRIVASSKDPAQAAEAQLRTAQAHQAAGKWELADASYRKVIARYPGLPQAAEAVVRLANMHFLGDNADAAIAACVWAAEQEPNSSWLAEAATHKLADLCIAAKAPDLGRAELHSLAESFHGTPLSAWAGYYGGDLTWRNARWETAAEGWSRLWADEPFARHIPLLPERLAESRYRAAYEAYDQGEYEEALAWFGTFSEGPPSGWRRRNVFDARLTLDTADCYAGLKQWEKVLELVAQATKQKGADQQEDHALYLEGCAHWGLGNWDAAVHAWQVCLQRYPLTEWGNRARERMTK